MSDLLDKLKDADFAFIIDIIDSYANFTSDKDLKEAYATFITEQNDENRAKLTNLIEKDIRYLGSSDLAYFARHLVGQKPGVSFPEIIRDVAESLKVPIVKLAPVDVMLKSLTERYVDSQLKKLSPKQQQEILEGAGLNKEQTAELVKKHGTTLCIAVIIEVAGFKIVQKIIMEVVIATIAKIIGKEAAKKLIAELMKKFPWWAEWIGPIMWVVSIAWLTFDLQGPAKRKTIPIVLYLGMCQYRESDE